MEQLGVIQKLCDTHKRCQNFFCSLVNVESAFIWGAFDVFVDSPSYMNAKEN